MYWGSRAQCNDGERRQTSAEAVIEKYVSENELIVFASSGCPFCSQAISALQAAGFSPTVVEVSPDERRALAEKCGSRSVPKVFAKGNFIGGCNDGGMGGVLPLLKNGKLKELMM
mmetsp:Transcript_79951/g.126122  ORF Transcript_79951/g.126122 Transcript_79951/m.126122 type:complete len:115 (-) Transcript_79951:31-375(-)